MVKPKKNRNFFQFAPKPFGHAPKAAGGQVWGPKNTRDLYFHFSFAYTDANAFSSKAEKIVLIIETSSQVLLCMHPLSSYRLTEWRGIAVTPMRNYMNLLLLKRRNFQFKSLRVKRDAPHKMSPQRDVNKAARIHFCFLENINIPPWHIITQ